MIRIGRIRFGCVALGFVLAAPASEAGAQSAPVWVNPDLIGGRTATPVAEQSGAAYPTPGPERYRLPFNRPGKGVRPLVLSPPGTEPRQHGAEPAPSAPPPTAEAPAAAPPPKRPATVAAEPEPPAPELPAPRPLETATAAEPSPPAPTPAATPVVARTPVAVPTQEVAAVPSAVLPDDTYRLVFDGAEVDVDAADQQTLAAIASQLQGTSERIQVMAYADDPNETTDWKRRVSLKRAQNVRKVLLAHDVQSFRILVRALGQPGDDGPGNRVDVTIGAP